jgi:hypothetical protein
MQSKVSLPPIVVVCREVEAEFRRAGLPAAHARLHDLLDPDYRAIHRAEFMKRRAAGSTCDEATAGARARVSAIQVERARLHREACAHLQRLGLSREAADPWACFAQVHETGALPRPRIRGCVRVSARRRGAGRPRSRRVGRPSKSSDSGDGSHQPDPELARRRLAPGSQRGGTADVPRAAPGGSASSWDYCVPNRTTRTCSAWASCLWVCAAARIGFQRPSAPRRVVG